MDGKGWDGEVRERVEFLENWIGRGRLECLGMNGDW